MRRAVALQPLLRCETKIALSAAVRVRVVPRRECRLYRAAMPLSEFRRGATQGGQALLDLFTIEKALCEIRYELSSRPAWPTVPVQGLVRLLTVDGRVARRADVARQRRMARGVHIRSALRGTASASTLRCTRARRPR